MIERFNFYDIYGYVIPGLVLLAVVWLPVAVLTGQGISIGVTEGVIATVLAYVVGHLLQQFSRKIVPTERGGAKPSSFVLDGNTSMLAALTTRVKERFKLDLAEANRDAVCMQCRAALITAGRAGYAEQFQGLYTLMRGCAAALGLGALEVSGFYASRLDCLDWSWVSAATLAVTCFAYLRVERDEENEKKRSRAGHQLTREQRKTRINKRRLILGPCVAASMVSAGALVASTKAIPPSATGMAILVALVFASLVCHGTYHYFVEQFAVAVYRDFLDLTNGSALSTREPATPPSTATREGA